MKRATRERWSRLASVLGSTGLVVVSALPGCTGSPETPNDLVEKFYEVRLELDTVGAPGLEELGELAPYLSIELRELLAQARNRRDQDAAQAPQEKPAFAEGDLFSSLFEGPTSFKVGADEATGDIHRVSVQLAYDAEQPVVSWTDKVVVIQEAGRWVVADIEYGGNWEFGNRGSLVSMLKGTLAPAAAAGALGVWVVVGHRNSATGTVNAAKADALRGRVLTYEAEAASSGKDVCPKAGYRSREEPAAHVADRYRLSPHLLGMRAADAKLSVTEVTCGGVAWATLGGVLLQVSDTRAFAPWNGTLFELSRK